MNDYLLGKITQVVELLDEIDEYGEGLIAKLSNADMSLSDYRHFLKDNSFDKNIAFKVALSIKDIGIDRANIKKDMEIYRVYNNNINKLLNQDTRQFLLTEINKKIKPFYSQYKYRVLTELDVSNLKRTKLKGRKIKWEYLKIYQK